MRKFALVAIICCFGLFGCATMEQKAAIDAELDALKTLTAEMNTAYERYKSGELSVGEFKDLTSAVKDQIASTKDEVERLKAEGMGWPEMIGMTLLGMASRGIPSKGPAGMLFSLMGARRREDA